MAKPNAPAAPGDPLLLRKLVAACVDLAIVNIPLGVSRAASQLSADVTGVPEPGATSRALAVAMLISAVGAIGLWTTVGSTPGQFGLGIRVVDSRTRGRLGIRQATILWGVLVTPLVVALSVTHLNPRFGVRIPVGELIGLLVGAWYFVLFVSVMGRRGPVIRAAAFLGFAVVDALPRPTRGVVFGWLAVPMAFNYWAFPAFLMGHCTACPVGPLMLLAVGTPVLIGVLLSVAIRGFRLPILAIAALGVLALVPVGWLLVALVLRLDSVLLFVAPWDAVAIASVLLVTARRLWHSRTAIPSDTAPAGPLWGPATTG